MQRGQHLLFTILIYAQPLQYYPKSMQIDAKNLAKLSQSINRYIDLFFTILSGTHFYIMYNMIHVIIVLTREIALMIQLEQQQHREFWVVGWVGRQVGDKPTTYIQLTCGWINKNNNLVCKCKSGSNSSKHSVVQLSIFR